MDKVTIVDYFNEAHRVMERAHSKGYHAQITEKILGKSGNPHTIRVQVSSNPLPDCYCDQCSGINDLFE